MNVDKLILGDNLEIIAMERDKKGIRELVFRATATSEASFEFFSWDWDYNYQNRI